MEIKIVQTAVELTWWRTKVYSIIFVEKEEHINVVWQFLVRHDNDWIKRKEVIQVKPEVISSFAQLNKMCCYSHKCLLPENFKREMELLGIDTFIYQHDFEA